MFQINFKSYSRINPSRIEISAFARFFRWFLQHDFKSFVQAYGLIVPILEQQLRHRVGVGHGQGRQRAEFFPIADLYFVDFEFHTFRITG